MTNTTHPQSTLVNTEKAPGSTTGRPLRAPDPALVDGQRVLIEAEVCAGGKRIHTIRPQQFGKIVYLDLAEVVVHRDLPVQAVMDRIDATAAETMRRVDTIAAALNAGAPGWSQAMAATNARLRSHLAEARQQRDQATEALVQAETERDEALCAITKIAEALGFPGGNLCEAIRALKTERDEARDRLRTLIDEVWQHLGQDDCPSYGHCLGRIRDRAHALAAMDPETPPRMDLIIGLSQRGVPQHPDGLEAAALAEIDRLRAELEMAEQDRDLARQAAEGRQRERDEARAALATAERERDALRTQLRRALDELGTTGIPTDEGVRWLAESLLGAREKLAAVAEIADNLEKAEVGSVMTYGDAAATLRAALGSTPDTGSTDDQPA